MLLTGLSSQWPLGWALGLQSLTGLIIISSLWQLDWRRLQQFGDTSVWAGTSLACALLWHLSAGIEPGLNFHLFGTGLMTLMFGFRFMVLGGLLCLGFHVAGGWMNWTEILWPALFILIIPGALTHLCWRASLIWLPPNFFVYSWGVSFAGVSLAIAANSLILTLVLSLSGLFETNYLLHFFLPYSLMQVFPEGLITGMLMTLLVLYQPTWVTTFHDRFYLSHQSPQDAHRRPRKRQTTDQPGGPPDD